LGGVSPAALARSGISSWVPLPTDARTSSLTMTGSGWHPIPGGLPNVTSLCLHKPGGRGSPPPFHFGTQPTSAGRGGRRRWGAGCVCIGGVAGVSHRAGGRCPTLFFIRFPGTVGRGGVNFFIPGVGRAVVNVNSRNPVGGGDTDTSPPRVWLVACTGEDRGGATPPYTFCPLVPRQRGGGGGPTVGETGGGGFFVTPTRPPPHPPRAPN